MSSIYVELKASNSSRTVDRSLKSGNTYIFFVNENFDVKNRNDLLALAEELNVQLKQSHIEEIDFKSIERELGRLEIGRRVSVRI